MSSKLVLEGNFVRLCEVHLRRNNLKVASLMLTTRSYGLHVVYVQLRAKEILQYWNLCVYRSDPRVVTMLEELGCAPGSLGGVEGPKVIGSSQTAKSLIHFENVEDFFHWVVAHGGYFITPQG